MNKNNKLALIVAYYLARFDREALHNLGFTSFNEAFEITAKKLNVKKNYVKLRRDEFDPIFPWRQGWKRPMDRQIIRTIETFQDFDESDLQDLVKNLLESKEYRDTEEIQQITTSLLKSKKLKSGKKNYVLRSPTGVKAENFFINQFNASGLPVMGKLVDTRDLGCGYDFKVIAEDAEYFIEVKGMSGNDGGILFTNKEWKTAQIHNNFYYLVVVKNLEKNPEVIFIKDPTSILEAKKNIYTIAQIQWSVSEKNLKKFTNQEKIKN